MKQFWNSVLLFIVVTTTFVAGSSGGQMSGISPGGGPSMSGQQASDPILLVSLSS